MQDEWLPDIYRSRDITHPWRVMFNLPLAAPETTSTKSKQQWLNPPQNNDIHPIMQVTDAFISSHQFSAHHQAPLLTHSQPPDFFELHSWIQVHHKATLRNSHSHSHLQTTWSCQLTECACVQTLGGGRSTRMAAKRYAMDLLSGIENGGSKVEESFSWKNGSCQEPAQVDKTLEYRVRNCANTW